MRLVGKTACTLLEVGLLTLTQLAGAPTAPCLLCQYFIEASDKTLSTGPLYDGVAGMLTLSKFENSSSHPSLFGVT